MQEATKQLYNKLLRQVRPLYTSLGNWHCSDTAECFCDQR